MKHVNSICLVEMFILMKLK